MMTLAKQLGDYHRHAERISKDREALATAWQARKHNRGNPSAKPKREESRRKIMAVLAKHPEGMRRADLAELVGINAELVGRRLEELAQLGLIWQPKRGWKWFVTIEGEKR